MRRPERLGYGTPAVMQPAHPPNPLHTRIRAFVVSPHCTSFHRKLHLTHHVHFCMRLHRLVFFLFAAVEASNSLDTHLCTLADLLAQHLAVHAH